MSWLFSQALVEEYLGDISLDGELSAPLSGNNTQQAYCAPDKMTKFCRLSQYGMTYKPLTENLGAELLTLYLADFHARTLVPQEKGQELTENGQECGEKWHGLLAKYDPDTHSWRTVQCSLLEDLNESLQTLPQWGMTVGGELYLLPTLVQTTNEKESGLWLTPSTVDIPTRSADSMKKRLEYRQKIGRNGVGAGCLSEQVEWSGMGNPIGYITKDTWPTPTAHMAKETNAPSEHNRNTPTLTAQVNWPTPRAADFKGATSAEAMSKAAARGYAPNLPEATAASVGGGKLNPTWVEWLMGWPLGWTDLKPLEMDKCLYARLPLGESSQEICDGNN
jgi:hypothetical protein